MKPIRVPFNDIRAGYAKLRGEIDCAIGAVIDCGDFINGAAVGEFEAAFANFTGARYCVACSSGTTALHLLMAAAGIGIGDEVITSPSTFAATAEAILHAGATPVFADIDPATSNLCVESVEKMVSKKTRAVLFVHLHGNPAHAKAIAEFCKGSDLLFMEDCAQAHGTWIGERHAGRLGIGGTFSFFPAKNLGAFGDAGCLITDSENLATRAAKLANHGRSDKYRHDLVGYNYRMDTLQAAVLRVRLARLAGDVAARRQIAAHYREGLAGLPMALPDDPADGSHSYHLFAIHVDQRDELQKFLEAHGVQTGVHYPIPLHRQMGFTPWLREGLPNAERESETTLSLPTFPTLSLEQARYVTDTVHDFYRR